MSIIRKEQVDEMYANIKFEKNDLGMSWIHKEKIITPFNKNELMDQIMEWYSSQSSGEYTFRSLECNKRTVQTDDGQTWYIVVVQQHRPDGEMIDLPLCAMSLMLFGFGVSGYVSAFKEKLWRNIVFKFVNKINETLDIIRLKPQNERKFIISLFVEILAEETAEQESMERERQAEEERLRRIQQERNEEKRKIAEEKQKIAEAKRLEKAKVKAEEAEAKLLADMKAEEDKKSSPKKKKEKKVKEAKLAVNPHKKEIRVSEGIWKPNPAWKKWEQENK
jgi:hypothetical protein